MIDEGRDQIGLQHFSRSNKAADTHGSNDYRGLGKTTGTHL
jgi:hypothetical protein